MKKGLAISLVVITLLQCGGMMIFHLVERAMHKSRVREEIARTQDWTSFEFTSAIWESIQEEEGEFSWKGVMYDIVHLEQSGDHVQVQAYPDVKESGIARLIKRWSGHHADEKHDASLILLKWSISMFLPSDFFTLRPSFTTSHSPGMERPGHRWKEVCLEVRQKPPVQALF
ncbi:MAG: hypothetical protein ACKO6L_09200 [Flavobacteriales bacterium]